MTTMKRFSDVIANTPAAWSPAVIVALLTGIVISPLYESAKSTSLFDIVKELGLLIGATLLVTLILKKQGSVFQSKTPSKHPKDQFKAFNEDTVPAQLPAHFSRQRRTWNTLQQMVTPSAAGAEKPTPPPPVQESRQPSKRPVQPPTFTSKHFDDQADELSQQLLPTERCQKVVQEIVQDVKKTILQGLPYADVVGFANGEVSRGTAYGVAVPEVDIVVNLPPHILVRTVQANTSKLSFAGKVDDRRLHKSAIRMCTDLLVSSGGFKFRRSAFRVRDPKVTLMAPRSLDDSGSIPVDFSVNAATPLCNSVLIAASARVDQRAQMLILLVKRWAKDRGICHAAKGHLMPYCWTLLTIYFLQVGVKEGSLLPPFKHLRLAPEQETTEIAGLAQCMQGWEPAAPGSPLAKKRLGQLFKEFINFYVTEVDWRYEVASIRTGQRAAPHRSFKSHILETAAGNVVGPAIEDPFMPSENMSEMLTAHGFHRLGEELARAQTCLESNTALSEIFTQYVPPEQKAQPDDSDEEADTGKGASRVPPTPTAITSIPPTRSSVQNAPWKKSAPVMSAPAAKTTSAPAMAKQQMTPPPGVWAVNGHQSTAWSKPAKPTTNTWTPNLRGESQ